MRNKSRPIRAFAVILTWCITHYTFHTCGGIVYIPAWIYAEVYFGIFLAFVLIINRWVGMRNYPIVKDISKNIDF